MMVHVISSDRVTTFVVDLIQKQLEQKNNSVIGLATGSTPIPIYKECINRVKKGKMSFHGAVTVNLDEYVDLSTGHEQSYSSFMQKKLFNHIDIDHAHTHIPNGNTNNLEQECRNYDSLIEQVGGIDLQLLGIGHNGHVGFNEPGLLLSVMTHVVKLSPATREANSRFFSHLDEVPTHAITMGMGGILKAKHLILAATGRHKAEIIKRALCGAITTEIPASFLQLHSNVTVVLDEEAGCLLEINNTV